MCDSTPYTLYHNDCSFSPQEYVVLVVYHNSLSFVMSFFLLNSLIFRCSFVLSIEIKKKKAFNPIFLILVLNISSR